MTPKRGTLLNPSTIVNILILLASFFIFSPSSFAQTVEQCQNATRSLLGDLDVIQAQGGIWGYMESNTALRDRSVMGLQIDSKMRRAIVLFKRECDEGNPPKPEVYRKIVALIEKGKEIYNLEQRTPPDKILKKIVSLKKSSDQLVENMEK